MAHVVKKRLNKEICTHCGTEAEVWLVEYYSTGMKSKVYLCGSCGKSLKTKNKIHFNRKPFAQKPLFV